jgi:hypothetical protein
MQVEITQSNEIMRKGGQVDKDVLKFIKEYATGTWRAVYI